MSCLSVPVSPTHSHPTLLPTEVPSSYRYLTVAQPIYSIMSNRPLLPHHKIQTTALTMQNTCCDKVLTFLFTTHGCSSDTIYYHSPNTPSPLANQHLRPGCALCLPIAPDATVMIFTKARGRTPTLHQTPQRFLLPVPPCLPVQQPAAAGLWKKTALEFRVGDQRVPGDTRPRGQHEPVTDGAGVGKPWLAYLRAKPV